MAFYFEAIIFISFNVDGGKPKVDTKVLEKCAESEKPASNAAEVRSFPDWIRFSARRVLSQR